MEFSYDVTVNTVAAGTSATNTITANYTGNDTATGTDDNRNHTPISNSATIAVDSIGIQKSIESTTDSSTLSAQNTASQEDLTLGEEITYKIALAIPQGVTNNLRFTDILSASFELLDAEIITTNSITTSITPTISTASNTASIDFGNVTNPGTSSTSAETIEIQITARVLDTNSNTDTIANIASILYEDPENPGNDISAPIESNTVTVDIVEPNITLTKTALSAKKPDGTPVAVNEIVL